MTTIATDGQTMAADGRLTSLDIVFNSQCNKLRRLRDGSIAAGAGESGAIRKIIAWVEDGGTQPKTKGARVLVLRPNGKLELADGGDGLIEVEAPIGIGTGGDIAIGAMEAGASPAEAVAIAARRDPFTGGDIQVMELGRAD